MGDMADFINDSMWEDDDSNPLSAECKFCGRKDLEWNLSVVDEKPGLGKWRLYTPSGKIHSCKKYWELMKPKPPNPAEKGDKCFSVLYASAAGGSNWTEVEYFATLREANKVFEKWKDNPFKQAVEVWRRVK